MCTAYRKYIDNKSSRTRAYENITLSHIVHADRDKYHRTRRTSIKKIRRDKGSVYQCQGDDRSPSSRDNQIVCHVLAAMPLQNKKLTLELNQRWNANDTVITVVPSGDNLLVPINARSHRHTRERLYRDSSGGCRPARRTER